MGHARDNLSMSVFRKLKLILTLTCDQSTRLVSDSHERELQGYERAALKLHMQSCKRCRRMRVQFGFLSTIAKRLRSAAHLPAAKMPPETKQRISERLRPK